MDLALRSMGTKDFCRKSSGFADFENTVAPGSAMYFGADS